LGAPAVAPDIDVSVAAPERACLSTDRALNCIYPWRRFATVSGGVMHVESWVDIAWRKSTVNLVKWAVYFCLTSNSIRESGGMKEDFISFDARGSIQ
jgi:hypothetical protein